MFETDSFEYKTIRYTGGDKHEFSNKDVGREYNPVRREVVHADFQQVNLSERINTAIPVVLVGEVTDGVLQQLKRELEISCLPAEIPESITVSIAAMAPGSALKVSDLVIPPGIRVLDDILSF